jgi:hypothetical protein
LYYRVSLKAMSATGLLRNKQFVAKLRKIFPTTTIKPSSDEIVPPLSKNFSQIGIAFDYLFRIYLARYHRFKHPHITWEADKSIMLLNVTDDSRMLPDKVAGYRLTDLEYGLGVKRINWALDVLKKAKELTVDYHRTGNFKDELLWSIYQLSFLEMAIRSGKAEYLEPDQLHKPDTAVIEELRLLLIAATKSNLRLTQSLYLSPGLRGDFLTQGASPDLVVDGWICDIKVASRFHETSRWVDQLVLYAAMADLAGFNLRRTDYLDLSFGNSRLVEIKGIAAYFARQGQWVPIAISDLVNRTQMRDIQNLLCQQYLGTNNFQEVQKLKRQLSAF